MTGELDVLRSALQERYTIEGVVGSGGMATVYRGRDVKHARAVAIKVLKPEVASAIGAARFLAEIQVTAGLQHPNILPLYDSGEADGLLYYVMPLIEGESLRDRLTRERLLPIDQAIDIIRAIAGALETAHEQGIVHRDIKPENILLHRGQAMVTDFGIALAVRSGTARMTDTGLALGTPTYMSPEQALGERELDARTDIYALGAMLYEMLSGQPPFTAATAQGVVAKVLSEPPASLTAERPTVPEHINAAVCIALEKLPADRFRTVRAFVDALGNPAFKGLAQTRATRVRSLADKADWRSRFVIPSLAIGALGLAAAVVAWLRPTPPAEQTLSYIVSLPPEQSLQVRYASRVAISPDGSRLVFVGPGAQGVRLYLRERSSLESSPIPGTEGAVAPFFSPDGNAVGFLNAGRQSLHVVTLGGGAVRTVIPSGVRRVGASWDHKGIVYVDETRGLVRWLPADSSVQVLLAADAERMPEVPHSAPDGDAVLFRRTSAETGEKELALLYKGKVSSVARAVAGCLVSPTQLVYATSEGRLLVADLDLSSGTVSAERVLSAATEVRFDAVDLAVSQRALVYGMRTADDIGELVLVGKNGAVRSIDDTWLANFQSVAFSPDGTRIATTVSVRAGEASVWVRPLQGGAPTRASDDQVLSFREAWHPTNGSIGFIEQRDEARDFWVNPTGLPGATTRRVNLPDSGQVNQAVWTRDGAWLLFRSGRVSSLDIKALRVQDSTVHPIAVLPGANEHSPTVSPDGRWVAYVSDRREKRNEVFVRPFPDAASGEWQVSTAGGTEPRWSPDGRSLYFKQGLRLMTVPVGPERTFSPGVTRPVMSVDGFYNFAFHPTYDVGPDGSMVMIRARHTERQFDVAVVQGWNAVGR